MNPLFFFTLSSHPSSLLIILIVTIIITVNTLPIDEGENRASRIAAIHSHLPAELNATLGNLLNFVDDLTEDHPATQHHLCYKSQSELNIFNRSLPFTAVVQWYYLYRFSSKPITSASISRLLDSTQNIINQCSSKKGNGLKYDFTVLSDQAFPYREALLMESKRAHRSKSPKSLGRRSSNGAEGETSSQCKLLPMDTSSPLPLTFDWRDHQAVTPVRSQRLCGSCWLFASMAALESALLLHESFSGLDPSSLDLAEQQLIVCANGCKGAEVADAYEYILQHGITFERHLRYNPHPYSGYFDDEEDSFASQSSSSFSTSTCTEELHRLLQEEKDEDYFEESSSFPKIIYPLEGYCWLKNNTDMEMKRALLKFGPLYVSLNAADSGIASGEFEGGAVNSTDCTPDPLNHSVLLVGYTEDTWILKNSWGRLWNGDGYFEVVQGREMCGINREMAWPLLKKKVF